MSRGGWDEFDPPEWRPFKGDPPPRDARQDRCIGCGSQAMLRPGYCGKCGEAVCRLCWADHVGNHDFGRRSEFYE